MTSMASFARRVWGVTATVRVVEVLLVVVIVLSCSSMVHYTEAFMMIRDDSTLSLSSLSSTKLYSTNTRTSKKSQQQHNTIFSGEVSQESTKRLNHYHIITQSVVYTPGSGRSVPMKDLLFTTNNNSNTTTTTNIVVFLRSLG